MFRASAQAVNILVAAQQECEEHYISLPEPELTVVALPTENKEGMGEGTRTPTPRSARS